MQKKKLDRNKNLGVLFSGGKDSCYAAYLAVRTGYKLGCLITIECDNDESFMFHRPFVELTKIQADFMRLPIVYIKSKGEKEKELKDLKRAIRVAIKKYKIQGVVTGAVESVYQASRIQRICREFGVECFNPLWQKDPLEHWHDLLKNNFKVVVTSVSAEGLGKEWVGKEINRNNLEELIKLSNKYRFHLGFEGGEAESFVLGCPLFNKKKLKSLVDYENTVS